MNIHQSPNNLSHCLAKHGISRQEIDTILANPDIITKIGANIRHYYSGDKCVIVTRNKSKDNQWFLKTAYLVNKDYLMGDIIWQKENI